MLFDVQNTYAPKQVKLVCLITDCDPLICEAGM